MVKLSVEEIREIIKPCGLSPRKSKAIHELSQILIDKHDGVVPDNYEDLEFLPGVGHKTDRKSTRLNSSHVRISYAVFCLKKKKKKKKQKNQKTSNT